MKVKILRILLMIHIFIVTMIDFLIAEVFKLLLASLWIVASWAHLILSFD